MSISFDHRVPVETVTPPPFFFFATQRAYSFWRYLWPFQSVRQSAIIFALTAIVLIMCSVVLPEYVDLRVRLLIFFCYVITVVRAFRERLPGKITIAISRGSVRQLIPDLKRAILELGFIDISACPTGEHFRFRSRADTAPGFYSPRQDFELSIADENIIEVLGAMGRLRQLIMKLNWKLEK